MHFNNLASADARGNAEICEADEFHRTYKHNIYYRTLADEATAGAAKSAIIERQIPELQGEFLNSGKRGVRIPVFRTDGNSRGAKIFWRDVDFG
jgi:hypothetical protein